MYPSLLHFLMCSNSEFGFDNQTATLLSNLLCGGNHVIRKDPITASHAQAQLSRPVGFIVSKAFQQWFD